jgi:integrase
LTVNDWLELWIGIRMTAGARTKTVEGYRLDQRHVARAIGEIQLNRLNADHIDRLWIAIMTSRADPATCAHVRRTLSAAQNAAVDRGHMAKNPVPLSPSPGYEPSEVEPFTNADARQVLDTAAGRRNSARWSVALALGLRQGEAPGLRWTDVDLDEARRLLIRVQLFHPPWQHGCLNPDGQPTCNTDPGRCPTRFGGQPILVPVKSKAGRRTLSLTLPLVEQLRRQSASQAAERLRAGSRSQNHGLVFAREDGTPFARKPTPPNGIASSALPTFAKAACTTHFIRRPHCCWSKGSRPGSRCACLVTPMPE